MTRALFSTAALSLSMIIGAPAFASHTAAHTAQQAAAIKAHCAKLSPAAAAKDAKCKAHDMAHADSMHAGDAMHSDDAMKAGDAMQAGDSAHTDNAMMNHDDASKAKPH